MTKKNAHGKNKWLILGIVLILSSGIAFALMLIIPFLDLNSKTRVIGSTISLVAMETLFWSGTLLTGKEIVSKYKERIMPKNWFRKAKERSKRP